MSQQGYKKVFSEHSAQEYISQFFIVINRPIKNKILIVRSSEDSSVGGTLQCNRKGLGNACPAPNRD